MELNTKPGITSSEAMLGFFLVNSLEIVRLVSCARCGQLALTDEENPVSLLRK